MTSAPVPDIDAAFAPPRAIGRLVLLGHPVAHSLSPRFQNAALAAAGIPVRYEALDVPAERLGPVLDALVAERAAGNATIPHKEALARRCDLLTPLARQVGAANTFWCTLDGRLIGDNTDVGGVEESVRALLGGPPRGPVALLGAGGSAAAVLAASAAWPEAEVRVWSRTPERAEELARRVQGADCAVARDVGAAVHGATLVVNATPLGLRDDDAWPAPPAALAPGAAVFDLVYRPGETRWVRACRAAGHRAHDGLGMLVAQGAAAFERWFGVSPDRSAMWDAVGGAPPRADASARGDR